MKEKDFIKMIEAFFKNKRSDVTLILEKIINELKMIGNDRFADQIRAVISNHTIIDFNDFNDNNLLDLIDIAALNLFPISQATKLPTFRQFGAPIYEEHHICELTMHKIIYLLYCRFYEKFKKPLFNANFVTGAFGPIELDYHHWQKSPNLESFNLISKFKQLPINQTEIAFLKTEIDQLLQHSTTKLVEMAKAQQNKWVKSTNKEQSL